MTHSPPAVSEEGYPAARQKKPIVFFGAGSQSVVLDELLAGTPYRLCAIFTDFAQDRTSLAPLIVGTNAIRAWADRRHSEGCGFAVAIGGGDGAARCEKIKMLKGLGLEPVSLVHRSAYVSLGVQMGDACQLLAKSFCGVNTQLGAGVILNSGASVDHECVLEDGVHVAPGSVVLGRVRIGRHTFVGANSTILPDLTIAGGVVLGAGCLVTRDILQPGTYVGAPARRMQR